MTSFSWSFSTRRITQTFQTFLFAAAVLFTAPQLSAQNLDVPYVPTPQSVVEQMLDLTEVNSSDYVIDLGSGDGRIVIAAAKRGATGHGIDLDPQRIAEARKNASKSGVDNKVMFMEQDLFKTDFSRASVITMYLLPSINERLRPKLLEQLEPGTRIVSHSFDMGDWEPDKQITVNNDSGAGTHEIYYWVIPARTNGSWSWTAQDKKYTMDVAQKYQEVDVSLSDGSGTSYEIQEASLHGPRLTVRASNGDEHYIFSGRVEGDQIKGTMQHHNGEDKSYSTWSATKN